MIAILVIIAWKGPLNDQSNTSEIVLSNSQLMSYH